MPDSRRHTKAKPSYVTLDSVVKNVISDSHGSSTHEYLRMLQWGIRGIKKFNFDITSSFKSVEIPVTSTGTIDLPSDFVDYIVIGSVIAGRVIDLTYNRRLNMNQVFNSCGQPELIDRGTNSRQIPGIFADATWYFYNYRNGQNLGQIFGFGGLKDGEGYRIDEDRGIIQFSNNMVGSIIYLEYLTDGLSPSGDTLVHVHTEEALIQWIHWKRIEHKAGMAESKIERKKRAFKDEYRLAKERLRSFTGDEFLDAVRRNYSQAIKS